MSDQVTCECCEKRLPAECAATGIEGESLCGRCVASLDAPIIKAAFKAVDAFRRGGVLGPHPMAELKAAIDAAYQPPASPATQQQEVDGQAAQEAISAIDAVFKFLDDSGLFEEGGGLPLYEATKPLAAVRVKLAESLPATSPSEQGGDGEAAVEYRVIDHEFSVGGFEQLETAQEERDRLEKITGLPHRIQSRRVAKSAWVDLPEQGGEVAK